MDSRMLSQGVGAGTWAYPQPRRSEEEEKPELFQREPGLEMKTTSPHPEPRFPSQLCFSIPQLYVCLLGLVRGPSQLLELASYGSSLGPHLCLSAIHAHCQQSPGCPSVRLWPGQTLMPLAERARGFFP